MTSFKSVATANQPSTELTSESLIEVFFHKLSQPIGTLYCTLELAAMSDDPARHSAAIQSGLQEVEKLNWLFHATRTLFGEDFAEGSECIPLREILHIAIQNYIPVADDRNVCIRFEIKDESRVWANPRHLLHSLENLLANSIKHSQFAGIVRVDVICESASVRVRIADDSPWIPEQAITLFDPFPPAEEGFPESSGNLDLCLSQRIIRAYGGEVYTRPSSTLTRIFEITLPRANQQRQ